MSKYLVATKQFDNSDENQNKFIIGKNHFENINQNETFSTIKKFFETKFQLVFDSQGGNTFESIEVILGKTYGELPIPTKTQNIFLGWFTASSGGTQITSETLVSLDINILYAQWEEIQITSDCTSYKVTTTSSYKNTGIYQASTYNSNEYTYIDWGDGSVEKFKGNLSQKTHTYKTIGTFTVKVSNNLTSFGVSYSNSTWYNSTSQNRYTFKEMLTTGSRITSLPQYAFYYCQAMTNIDFMETCFSNVTSLPSYCFYYCTGLTSIQGAKRFTGLGSYCFQYCSGLTGIQDLSEFKFTSLTNSYVFANCSNVKQWILPTGFTGTQLGDYSFYNCTSLSSFGYESNLPYDAEIEYLESTGTQWIDTEIQAGMYEITAKIQQLSYINDIALFGCWQQTPRSSVFQISYYNNRYYFGCSQSVEQSVNIPGQFNTDWHVYKLLASGSFILDDTILYNINNNYVPCELNIFLFARNLNGSVQTNTQSKQTRISLFQISDIDTGQLIIDLIPVRVGNVGYMYDKVSKKLFGNSGTGEFILGPDKGKLSVNGLPNSLTSVGSYCFYGCSNLKSISIPKNVTALNQYAFYNCTSLSSIDYKRDLPYDAEIEYLESTGTQWIDSEIYGTEYTTANIIFAYTKIINDSAVIGCDNGAYNHGAFNIGYHNKFRFIRGNQIKETTLVPTTNIYYNVQSTQNTFIVDDISYDISTPSSFKTNYTIPIYAWIRNNNILASNMGYYKIKNVQFLENNVIIRDFIPVRVGNVGYMYDKVSKKLFGNSGTGNFILGPDVRSNASSSNLTLIGNQAFYNTTSLKTFDIPESVKSIGSYAFYSSGNNVDKSAEEMPYDAEIDYLKGSASQYIDTGITAKNTIGVELEVTVLPSLNIWFGIRPNTSSTNSFGLRLQTYPNKFISFYNSGTVNFTSEKSLVEGQKVKIKCETGKVYIDDELIYTHSTSASAFDSTPHTMYLFTEQYLEKPVGDANNKTQIHSCKIYRTYDNLMLADFIPVRIGGVGYIYDRVTNKLFENKGTGDFILGPDKIVYDRDVGSKLKLPNELTSLGENAFQNCKTLKQVTIPSSLESIGNNTFAGCSNLSSIIDNRPSAQNITDTTFGSSKTESETTYTGYNTKGNNILSIYYDSINYQEGNWFDILQNPDKCGFNLKFIDPENVKYCKVTLDVGDGILSTTQLNLIQGYKYGELPEPICPFKIPYFHGWYYINENESEILVTKNSYVPNQDTITLYAHYSTEPLITNQYEVFLNDQWRESTKTNPDSNIYDGVYESFSNYNIGNKAAVMYIKISGYTSFTLYIRSYAESNYDYTVVFNLDVYTPTKPLTSNPSSSTTGVKAHTSGKQNNGTTIGSYTKVEYTEIDGGEHYICIAYRKDGSVNNNDDRGYILIDKSSAESAEIDPRYVLTTTDQSTLQDEDATFVMATEI